MATFSIVIAASAVDSALTDEVVRVSTLSVGSTVNAAIFTADTGSGADVWASSDEAGTSRIGLKLVYWDDGSSEFAVDIAAASLSSVSDTTVYLQVGSKPAGDVDPYPSTAEGAWPLMADFDDDTANGNNGTAIGGVTAGGATGPDGVLPATTLKDAYIYVGSMASLKGVAKVSFSGWMKVSSTFSAHQSLLASRDNWDNYTILGFNNNDYWWHVEDNNVKTTIITGTASSGTWYHLAGVFDGGTGEVWANGVSVGTDSSGPALTPTTSNGYQIAKLKGGEPNNLCDVGGVTAYSSARSAASFNLEYLLAGSNGDTYITAAEVATFNPAWALNSNVLIGAA